MQRSTIIVFAILIIAAIAFVYLSPPEEINGDESGYITFTAISGYTVEYPNSWNVSEEAIADLTIYTGPLSNFMTHITITSTPTLFTDLQELGDIEFRAIVERGPTNATKFPGIEQKGNNSWYTYCLTSDAGTGFAREQYQAIIICNSKEIIITLATSIGELNTGMEAYEHMLESFEC